jgi:threonyl-tRNA synthetase
MALLNCHHAFYELLQHCLVQEKQPFERIEVSRAEALEMFADSVARKYEAVF